MATLDARTNKCFGVIGGLTSEGAAVFTRLLHEEVRGRIGAAHSANLRCALLDKCEVASCCSRQDWANLSRILLSTAHGLAKAGAQALLLDSSTLHLGTQSLATEAGIPLIHVVEVCERALTKDEITSVGLLGTRCIAEEAMWRGWLFDRAGIDIALPSTADRELVHEIMDLELARGRIKEASRVTIIRTMKALKRAGARAVIVVAPELLPITFASDTTLRFYAAARLHARAAVQWAFATVPQAA